VSQEPVKVVFERRARPGAESRLTDWIRRLVDSAQRAAGLEGSSVLTRGTSGDFLILFRFDGADSLSRWQESGEVRALLAESGTIALSGGPAARMTGLETWFQLPGLAAPLPPPRWKMALVTFLALVPQILALRALIPTSLPVLVQVAVGTAIPVTFLTWVVMPWLAVALRGWLYASGGSAARSLS